MMGKKERPSFLDENQSEFAQTQTFKVRRSDINNPDLIPNFIDTIFVKDHRNIKDVLGTTIETNKPMISG